jgi:tetratricopeptide (TPR) repeat protein
MLASEVSELFAQAYAEAARSDANMRETMPALEETRDAIRKGSTFHDVLNVLQTQIGQVDLRLLAPVLRRFRDAYTDTVVNTEVARLNAAFEHDAGAGWLLWLTAFAELFDDGAWRTRLAVPLAERCLKVSPHPDWPVERVRRNVWLAASGRWPESYDWFVFLSNQDLAPPLRARMLSIAAEIQLYRFSQPGRAQRFIDRAKELAADELLVSRVQAEIYQTTDRVADAEREYRTIVERKPALADGYSGLAECADARKEPVAAEAYYKQAVLFAPGQVSAHSDLMNWYARQIEDHEPLVMSTFDRVIALSTTPADEYLNLGLRFRTAKRLDKARELLEKALEIAPDQTLPEVWLGYFDIDEATDRGEQSGPRLVSARSHFARDMAACPEAFDGPWGQSSVALQEHDWAAADEWCQQALAKNPEWENSVRARQATIAMERADLVTAERHVMRCLDLEPRNSDVWNTLYQLSEKLFEAREVERADRLLERWRQLRGESVEYLYQNELGRREFSAERYGAAIEFFEKAVAASPDDPVLYSNAASAAENLRTTENRSRWLTFAIDRLTHAERLAPDQADYRARLTTLRVEERFISAYSERALTSVPTVAPLRVEVPSEMLPLILTPQLTELSEASLSSINLWKLEYRKKRGVALPGLLFGVRDSGAPPNAFRMIVRDQDDRIGETAGEPVLADILRQLEGFVNSRLGDLVGHEEIAALLRETAGDSEKLILASPARLTSLVVVVKERLERGSAIHDLPELARAIAVSDIAAGHAPTPADPSPAADLRSMPPAFSLHARGLRGVTLNYAVIWERICSGVFASRGVIVPMIAFCVDEKLSEGDVELRVNGRRADVQMNDQMSEAEITLALRNIVERAAESLVVTPLVEWYLAKIAELTPALGASVSQAFPIDALIGILRTRVRLGQSIRDLPLVLENVLRTHDGSDGSRLARHQAAASTSSE